jgi:prepilin-type N-terminal cleavage/methylation domain-containing protein
MKKQKGFSLIELLIVVAIILIIAAIAIPNLMRSRMAANEASAVGSLRTLNTAEVSYYSTYGTGYAPLANLGGAATPCVAAAATACLIDPVLTGGAKSGYNIATSVPAALGTVAAQNVVYETNATPIQAGQSGQRSFCGDQSGVIRANPAGGAAPAACAAAAAYLPLQ